MFQRKTIRQRIAAESLRHPLNCFVNTSGSFEQKKAPESYNSGA